MKITYSPKRDGSKESYEMKVGAVLLGICVKLDGEFMFTPAEALGVSFEVRTKTMRKAKEEIEAHIPPILRDKINGLNTREKHYTVFEAKTFAGLSHSEVRELLREIYTFHRYLEQKRWGDFMVRRAMEGQAEFEWGKYARVWLVKNPHAGEYQPVSEEMWALYAKRMHVEFPGEKAA
jgi:hypothetical protein